jgi:T-complex protein 1 subunit alpha
MTSKGIDDMYMKYFVEAGCVAVRRVEKADLRRLAKATGGTPLPSLPLSLSKAGADGGQAA